jgi:hypothetical protein
MRKEDLTDRRFGALVAKSYKYPRKWLCQCDCGNLVEVFTDNLTRGHTRSCGCKKGEMTADALTRHGKADSKVYNCWRNMKNRCYNSQSKDYPEYGGRGINVCDRWLESFANFYADMGDPPTPHHSIDRKDVDGDYFPANCRWVTPDTQANKGTFTKAKNTPWLNGQRSKAFRMNGYGSVWRGFAGRLKRPWKSRRVFDKDKTGHERSGYPGRLIIVGG